MENSKVISIDQQFSEVVDIILQHKSRASKVVNDELLLSAWHVGGYVSAKLKSEEWGSKVVTQLSEFIRSQHPEIKGYSRSSIYNMVMFYDEYSSENFASTIAKYLNSEFVKMARKCMTILHFQAYPKSAAKRGYRHFCARLREFLPSPLLP